jgi:SpoVK/Ycf46/Vps4 family AAA+-type ATPase
LGSDPSQIPSNVSFHINTAPKSEEKMVDNFSSVGGNLAAKRALVEALALDPRKRRLMASCGMSAPTGVLLYGPPGTGKTLLARATAESMQKATEIGLSGAFISIRASDIILSDIGGSEKLLVETFETARRNSPSVVFIDEFEAIFNCPSDGGGTRGTSRLANTLLQCMDDAKRWRDADFAAIATEGKSSESSHGLNTSFSDIKGRVVILAATNAPWSVDKAFLRPGRFSKVVYVGLPTVEEREMIIKGIVGKMKLHLDDSASRMETVCTIAERIAADSDGFSGADLVGLCRAAAVLCLHEHGSDARYSGVAYHHFAMALKNTRPSCDPSLVNRLQRWRVNDRNR